MSALRAWLLSFFVATAFAMGVVAVVVADPTTMLDEEDQHSEESERGDEAGELAAHLPNLLVHPDVIAVDATGGTSISPFCTHASDGPSREHRIDLHRPPSI